MDTNPVEKAETIRIIIYAIITTIVAEGTLYFMIYRKDEYKRLKKAIDSTNSKLKKQKETYGVQNKPQEKKLSSLENQLKALNQDMTQYRMKSTILIGFFMVIVLSTFSTLFQGIVVARLPFQPFGLIQGITHRGLIGDDMTECSYIFLYILTSIIVRGNIQKIFGFEPPRSHFNSFLNPGGAGMR
eukprot:TRINITY_DN2744_c0_g1_i1.p1 TRINITY_DN2744_c0_g1~~TRINITY_DN2744_c0_g1_i1.p1  ORF type:complete len:186 (-),score=48.36 TRINITY_DN2744_c0_g1_i1:180-737(-)